jgi:hypothetical protein
VVLFSYATSVVHNFDPVQAILVEPNFYRDEWFIASSEFIQFNDNPPILVAPASILFSKSSFTAF